MEVPDRLAEEFGPLFNWGAADNPYKASAIISGGPVTAGHSENALHAVSRALVLLRLETDLTDYQ